MKGMCPRSNNGEECQTESSLGGGFYEILWRPSSLGPNFAAQNGLVFALAFRLIDNALEAAKRKKGER